MTRGTRLNSQCTTRNGAAAIGRVDIMTVMEEIRILFGGSTTNPDELVEVARGCSPPWRQSTLRAPNGADQPVTMRN